MHKQITTVNWCALIGDLQTVGQMTQADIAVAVGATQPTICRLANPETGSIPRYNLGAELVELHRVKVLQVAGIPASVGSGEVAAEIAGQEA